MMSCQSVVREAMPRRTDLLALVVIGVIALTGCVKDASRPRAADSTSGERVSVSPGPPTRVSIADDSVAVIVAAGDIACGDDSPARAACDHEAVAHIIRGIRPHAILLLGDIQYENGTRDEFERYFDRSWGAFKSILWPAPGNHEYRTPGAAGYFDYFNGVDVASGRAGVRGLGYYSLELGDWHLVALNSNCDEIGGCYAGSPQERWLRADLAASGSACVLAYWHHPRFSSGGHGDDESVQPLWQALYDHGPAVVLNGHDHDYERLAPLTPDGRLDEWRGLRQFVVGTGGKEQLVMPRIREHSVARSSSSLGVLQVVLRPGRYAWQFVPVTSTPGSGMAADSGSANCQR
jgi:acid phosphatase type 7